MLDVENAAMCEESRCVRRERRVRVRETHAAASSAPRPLGASARRVLAWHPSSVVREDVCLRSGGVYTLPSAKK